MLRFMGSQRVGHDWSTELNWNWTVYTRNSYYIANQLHLNRTNNKRKKYRTETIWVRSSSLGTHVTLRPWQTEPLIWLWGCASENFHSLPVLRHGGVGEGKLREKMSSDAILLLSEYMEPELGRGKMLDLFLPFHVPSGPLCSYQVSGVTHMSQQVPGCVQMRSYHSLASLGFYKVPWNKTTHPL